MILENVSIAFIDLVNINSYFQEAGTDLGLFLLLLL
jgi:hypothetical protein